MKNKVIVYVTVRHEIEIEVESEHDLLALAMEGGDSEEINRIEDQIFEETQRRFPDYVNILDYEVEYDGPA